MEIQAFALLCAFGVVSLLCSVTRSRQICYFLAGAAVGVMLLAPSWLWLPWNALLSSDPAQVSLLLFMLAFARVVGILKESILPSVAGLFVVIWLQALGSLGYPAIPALIIVAGASFTALLCSLRLPDFRRPALLDEAFLIVMLYALALAVLPEVFNGWRAAVGLRSDSAADKLPLQQDHDVLWLAAGFVLLGAVHATWKRFRTSALKTNGQEKY